MIRVVVVNADALVRAALRSVLAGYDDIGVVGEASNGAEGRALAAAQAADVVLADLHTPGFDQSRRSPRLTGGSPGARARCR